MTSFNSPFQPITLAGKGPTTQRIFLVQFLSPYLTPTFPEQYIGAIGQSWGKVHVGKILYSMMEGKKTVGRKSKFNSVLSGSL